MRGWQRPLWLRRRLRLRRRVRRPAADTGSTATGAVRLDSADHLAPEPVCWLARVLRADQRAEPSNNFVGVTLRGSAPVLPGPVSHAVRQARERASSRGPHAREYKSETAL